MRLLIPASDFVNLQRFFLICLAPRNLILSLNHRTCVAPTRTTHQLTRTVQLLEAILGLGSDNLFSAATSTDFLGRAAG